jgi:hypothetical protein
MVIENAHRLIEKYIGVGTLGGHGCTILEVGDGSMTSRTFLRLTLFALVAMTAACNDSAGPAISQLSIVAGNNQTATAGTALPVPLEVELTRGGNPLVDVPVEWTVTAGGGSLLSVSVRTSSDGHAKATLHLARAGDYSVEVNVPRFDVGAKFSATAVNPVVLHYDGVNWSPSLQESNALATGYAIWGTSASNIIVVGNKCDGELFVQYDGKWGDIQGCSKNTVPITEYSYRSISGTSPTDIYAIRRAAASEFLDHFDGSAWRGVLGNRGAGLAGVWAKAPNSVFLVRLRGYVDHYDGSTWTSTPVPGADLHAIWGDSGSPALFAVGNGGRIIYFDGATWRAQSSGTTQDLFSVWGNSASDVYAVGAAGTILHYDGVSWSSPPPLAGATTTLRGVWAAASNSVFVVGDGVILHYDGTSWTRQSIGFPMTLNAIWGTSPTNVYAVGSGPQ